MARAKRGPGHPPRVEGEETVTIGVRVTRAEREAFEAAAAREGLRLTPWMRKLAQEAAGGWRPDFDDDDMVGG